MNESIKIYFENKCRPIKEEFGFDIFKNIESYLDKLIQQNGLFSVCICIRIENSIRIAYDMIKYGARVNRKGRTFDEIFCFTPIKNTRLIKI